MVINTNTSAQNSARFLGESSTLLSKSLARLSSGSKLLSPEDDAAGMAVSMRFDAQITRTQAGMNNLGNALSFSQTQDGFLKKVVKALDRMSELAMLSLDATKSDSDLSLYNREFQSLTNYINDVTTKEFNGVSLFSANALNVTNTSEGGTLQLAGITGNYLTAPATPSSPQPYATSATIGEISPAFSSGHIWLNPSIPWDITVNASTTLGNVVSELSGRMQVINSGSASYNTQTGEVSVTLNPGAELSHYFGDNALAVLGFSGTITNSGGTPLTVTGSPLTYTPPPSSPSPSDISTASGARSALTLVKSAINQLSSDRAAVGAALSRLNLETEQLAALKSNLSAANSRIKDVDVAEESTNFARYNILVQAGTAMLSQANTSSSSLLRLLQ